MPDSTLKNLAKSTTKKKLINIKVTIPEGETLQARADKFAGGNLSGFLREAGKKWVPAKRDLVKLN